MRELSVTEYREKYLDPSGDLPEGLRLGETEPCDLALPKRPRQSHKYSYGRALLIAGALGYAGAPALAANACERSGAGLTHLMVPESIYPIAAARCDGAVVTPLKATEAGSISAEALPRILEVLGRVRACVIGPGLTPGADSKALVRAVLEHAACPLVLDADALTALQGETALLDACRAPLLLTPHEGEFKRLGGDVDGGRLAGALRFTREHPGMTLILKGYGTLICRDKSVCVNPTGGPAMAKGGSGDVLCGILTALLAQGFEPGFAARCAVWLHGRAGDLAAAELGEYSLAPSDLTDHLPRAFRELDM
ncbi:MAG: NAD(P)H-hydrate dehydratase [Oscillospiraceae bacterium]|nr:NAD(P)H-hydrate dehydratase [Oscillospiraceae bacterium]